MQENNKFAFELDTSELRDTADENCKWKNENLDDEAASSIVSAGDEKSSDVEFGNTVDYLSPKSRLPHSDLDEVDSDVSSRHKGDIYPSSDDNIDDDDDVEYNNEDNEDESSGEYELLHYWSRSNCYPFSEVEREHVPDMFVSWEVMYA